ncbi:hypothetical protein Pth03_50680 [Planotetraspora thailandica]|uniref:Uncharacterized protein n=1 Tax=Planotetraspora thailandica TaxID=487172 RepID=A0A8J3V2S5_9ACTN|nr:hypothetical protein [Planotetraspora thailandica]GII56679.1 hypothetical protein Pth03_50680 [Planotetraspora thailandica]
MVIQNRREAVQGWWRLDRRTRRELLHSRTPHPDPWVRTVAAAYAESRLGMAARLGRTAVAILWTMLVLVVTTVAAIVIKAESGSTIGFTLLPVILLAYIAGYVWHLMRRQLAFIRMKNLNSPGVAAPPPPVSDGASHAREPLIVRYDFKAMRGSWALAAALVIGVPALALATGRPSVYIPMIVAMALGAAFIVAATLRVVRRRKTPVLVLDSTGVSLPHYDFTVPWQRITGVRVLPMPGRAGARGPHRVVVFVPFDGEEIVRSAPPRLARALRRTMSFYGSPIVVIDKGLSAAASEIVNAAEALGGVRPDGPPAPPALPHAGEQRSE